MILRRRKLPAPPENVRVVKPDGTEIPIECVYDGFRDGAHVWTAVQPVMFQPQDGDTLAVDLLPGHTTVEIVGVGYTP